MITIEASQKYTEDLFNRKIENSFVIDRELCKWGGTLESGTVVLVEQKTVLSYSTNQWQRILKALG